MTPAHYQIEMNRLASTFNASAYSKERRDLIWREFGELPNESFTRMVNRFIGDSRQAPLLPDFREAAAKEREQNWGRQKQEERQSAENAVNALQQQESSVVIAAIVKRINGNLGDDAWKSVLAMLSGLGKLGPRSRCSRCQDTGAMFARQKGDVAGDYTFRCDCPAGKANRSAFAQWNFSMLREFEVCS